MESELNVLITISDVDTASDLSASKVKISVLPESKTEKALDAINKNLPEIQTRLFRKLRMGKIPKIKFEINQVFNS